MLLPLQTQLGTCRTPDERIEPATESLNCCSAVAIQTGGSLEVEVIPGSDVTECNKLPSTRFHDDNTLLHPRRDSNVYIQLQAYVFTQDLRRVGCSQELAGAQSCASAGRRTLNDQQSNTWKTVHEIVQVLSVRNSSCKPLVISIHSRKELRRRQQAARRQDSAATPSQTPESEQFVRYPTRT